ncbi:unnamed protein product [Rotaria sordida]|uniref:Uncharacterized protein n=1 Tax=Rotaria sordida TaxID=392033 RepID=A0A815JV93_9BILA|nr:unnamed protein product [Rotaria sordida]
MKTRVITITTIVNSQPAWISSYSTQKTDTSNQDFGWKVVGHTYDEQVRLRDMATMTAAWPKAVDNTVPTVPCLSADGHLLVLSASASRVRYDLGMFIYDDALNISIYTLKKRDLQQ